MSARTYKKYMKQNVTKDYTLLKLFVVSFFGMLLVFTFLIKSFSPSVDVSIGDYKEESVVDNSDEMKKVVDGRLAMIQEEDQGRSFTELMKNAGEGGAWGVADLALYTVLKIDTLEDFLDKLFAKTEKTTVVASKEEKEKFASFLEQYKKGLKVEKLSTELFN